MSIKKRYIAIGLTAAALAAGITTAIILKHQVHYETKPLSRCTITEIVEASGTINPVNTVSVGSTVSGLIKEIYADFNSKVKKDQITPKLQTRKQI